MNKNQSNKISFELPSLSYATSVALGPHRPAFTGVGDNPGGGNGLSYSLNIESNSGATEVARKSRGNADPARQSRGGTLEARRDDGGTLVARERARARSAKPTGRIESDFKIFFFSRFSSGFLVCIRCGFCFVNFELIQVACGAFRPSCGEAESCACFCVIVTA